MTRFSVLATVFVVILLAVFGLAAYGGSMVTPGMDAPPEIENEHYLDANLINDRTPGTAAVQIDTDVERQTIVIDPTVVSGGIRPAMTDRSLRPLVNALINDGHDVRLGTSAEFDDSDDVENTDLSNAGEVLVEADAYIMFRTDYSGDELDDLETFVDEGGRVLVATEPSADFDRAASANFESRFGVAAEPGYVYNMADNDLNYQRIYAEPGMDSTLTVGVDRVIFSTATPVTTAASDGEVYVPVDGSRLSTTRASTEAPVVVQNGGVVLVGDRDFMSPENAQRVDNDVLIGNIGEWLVNNDRDGDEDSLTDE